MVTLKIKKTPGVEEWQVVWMQDGKRDEGKTYYTDDKEDAARTLYSIFRKQLEVSDDVDISEDRSTIEVLKKYQTEPWGMGMGVKG